MSKVDLNKLKSYKAQGWLKSQDHPELPLTIWNYTPNTTYEGKWDEITMLCRGLVTDQESNVVAHPIPKFFNYGQLEPSEIPNEGFLIYEKVDGSYIQIFDYQGELVISSRGSFTSDQVLMAEEILFRSMMDPYEYLDPDYNYIFELIHPQNRIVVDYGNREELILLAKIDRNGEEDDAIDDYTKWFGNPISIPMLSDNWEYMKSIIGDNEEGFVVVYDSGFRMKIKGDEYCRLHRIITNTSSKDVWIALKDNHDMSEFLERIPDEFISWFKQLVGELYLKRRGILFQVLRDIAYGQEKGSYVLLDDKIAALERPRKEVAEYFNTCMYPKLMFFIVRW